MSGLTGWGLWGWLFWRQWGGLGPRRDTVT